MNSAHSRPPENQAWPDALYEVLRAAGIRHMSAVPDAGHTRLIQRFAEDPEAVATMLTTEEEGIAFAAGAWLGGMRSVVLMQSSGVGNCINMVSLPVLSKSPLLMLVTMRGEWREFNPWQMPMGRASQHVLEAMGITVFRADCAADICAVTGQAAWMAFEADQQTAVLIGQRLLGEKEW